MKNMTKRLNGQFFTTTNPFVNEAFIRWMTKVNEDPDNLPDIIEPFAGSNNIVWMIRELEFKNAWKSFDIAPAEENSVDDVPVEAQDTLVSFPTGFKVSITNPPYLAKNSASNLDLPYAGGSYEDLYQKALSVMLDNLDYVAAIIPETFVKQGLFHNRLQAVVSLNCQMFEDTSHPVCLALFVPEVEKKVKADFEIWRGNQYISTYKTLESYLNVSNIKYSWRFNDPEGIIGLHGADSAKGADIAFVSGDNIPSTAIKHSSRHNTRISLPDLTVEDAEKLIKSANKLLKSRREATKDVFMTAHRGLREDGKYRRRLDFSQARELLDLAYSQLNKKKV